MARHKKQKRQPWMKRDPSPEKIARAKKIRKAAVNRANTLAEEYLASPAAKRILEKASLSSGEESLKYQVLYLTNFKRFLKDRNVNKHYYTIVDAMIDVVKEVGRKKA